MIITNQRFAGQLGKEELAAASIGMSIQNLLWYFLLGSATSVDTLGSQAYGAGNRPAVLGWCISAAVAISLMCVPLSLWLIFGQQIASTLFRQPPDIAQVWPLGHCIEPLLSLAFVLQSAFGQLHLAADDWDILPLVFTQPVAICVGHYHHEGVLCMIQQKKCPYDDDLIPAAIRSNKS